MDPAITKSLLGAFPPKLINTCSLQDAVAWFEFMLKGQHQVACSLLMRNIKALRTALAALPKHTKAPTPPIATATAVVKSKEVPAVVFSASILFRSCAVINLYIFDKFVGVIDFGIAVRDMLISEGLNSL